MIQKEMQIGSTPLIKVENNIHAKLEWFNEFGSLKDRIAKKIVDEAIQKGELTKGKTILEASSGNTGIALAGYGFHLGYKVEIIIPQKVSMETKEMLKFFGATIVEVNDDLCPRVGPGTDQAIKLVDSLVKSFPGKYFVPGQYVNEANTQAHYETTGPEIWNQTNGKITHFVAGVGTGGTLTGVSQYLKEKNTRIEVIGVQPQKNHNIQGLRNLEESEKPLILMKRIGLIDRWITISDEAAFSAAEKLETGGISAGPSSGAVMAAMEILSKNLNGNSNIVGIFADNRERHNSSFKKLNGLKKGGNKNGQ